MRSDHAHHIEDGENAWLTAVDAERYLDFTAGIAVNVRRSTGSISAAPTILTPWVLGQETATIRFEPKQAESVLEYIKFCLMGSLPT